MGLLSLLPERRAIDASTFPYSGNDGGWVTLAGVAVDEDAALSVPTFSTCVMRKQDAFMAMPVDAYVTQGDTRIPVDGPAWLKRPNIEQTWKPFIGGISWSLDVAANTYIAVTRDGSGRAMELYLLDHRTTVPVRRKGRKLFEVNGREYPGQVIHITRRTRPGEMCGPSVIALNRQTFGLALAVQQHAGTYFATGGVPEVVFEMTGTQPDAKGMDAVAKWWRQARSKAGSGQPGFIWGGSAKSLGVNPAESQLTDVQNNLGVQIASLMGVPTHFVGLGIQGDSIQYQNIVDAFIGFMREAMLTPMELVQEALSDDRNALMPKAQRIRFRTEIFEKPDTKSRYEIYKIGIEAGFLTINEVRAYEDLQPLPATEAEAAQRSAFRSWLAERENSIQPGDTPPEVAQ